MSFLDELRTRLGLSPEDLDKVKRLQGNPVAEALNAPSSFDVNTSDTTARGSVPVAPPDPTAYPAKLTMDDITRPSLTDQMLANLPQEAAPAPEPTPMPPAPQTPPSAPPAAPAPAPMAAAPTPDPLTKILTGDPTEDQRRRDANDAAIEHKRRMSIIPELAGGVADAMASGAQGYGLNIPADTQSKIHSQLEKGRETMKTDFETKLRNDPKSDISKQYQALVAEMMGKTMDDPQILGLSANQIVEKVPAIEKIMERRSKEEIERLKMKQEMAIAKMKEGTKEGGETTAQKAVDKAFAKTYEDFVVQGGYGKAINQLSTLNGVLDDLKAGKSNLSGAGFKLLPDIVERVAFPKKVAAQQAVEQAIQEGLRATLGAQFTEREGRLFMERGYDPNLDEKENAKKLERAINQLKLMILSKRKAADYYEENGTLKGYKGDLYTVKNGEMTKASTDDFMKMLEPTNVAEQAAAPSATASPAAPGARKTSTGITYTIKR